MEKISNTHTDWKETSVQQQRESVQEKNIKKIKWVLRQAILMTGLGGKKKGRQRKLMFKLSGKRH